MALSAGTQLGRYTVLKPLALGGLAEVLLARASGSAGFSHHVVIKCIRANRSTDPRFVEMFLDEARLAASLHHHHIVQVHDVGREGNDYFFAMEYVHGEDVRKLLTAVARRHELIPLDQVITIATAVAQALHHAHVQKSPDGEPLGLVHRDVTPTNILVGYEGQVKVTDFGIAKAALRSPDITKSGSMRGKVAYMAPEQCLGRAVDRRCDIFTLGIVLYELATCRRLFKGDTDFLVMTSIVNGKIPKPTQFRSDLPLDLEDVMLKALAPSPALRYATAEDLAIALEQVATRNGIRISQAALAEYMSNLFGRRPEPWLVNDVLESVDVDFDGGGSGMVEPPNEEEVSPTIENELLESPLLAAINTAGFDDDGDFADEPKTEINVPDDDDEPPTLAGGNHSAAAAEAARLLGRQEATSGFEHNEQTILSEPEDVDMLVAVSKIDGRRDATPGLRDTTPMPRRDATPPPRAATPHPYGPLAVPVHVPVAQAPAAWSPKEPSGTPMAWIPQDNEVVSLRPRIWRSVALIAVVALPLVAIGVFVITREHDRPTAANTTEPDAFVEMAVDAAPIVDADVPIDAKIVVDASLVDAIRPVPKPAVNAPIKRQPPPIKRR